MNIKLLMIILIIYLFILFIIFWIIKNLEYSFGLYYNIFMYFNEKY